MCVNGEVGRCKLAREMGFIWAWSDRRKVRVKLKVMRLGLMSAKWGRW